MTDPNQSLREHPAPPATDRSAGALVIGAGPVGLSAALALRGLGLDVLVVEGEPENRLRPGSRAIFLHHEPLQLLDSIVPGIADAIADAGVLWHRRLYTYRGKTVYLREFPAVRTIEFGASLPQVETEAILMRKAVEMGVRFQWGSPVTSVRTTKAGVDIELESGQSFAAPYAIAADGSRSATRKALGLSMEGKTHDIAFLIVDVDENPDAPLPLELSFHYKKPELGGRNLLFVPFKGGWRVDLQCFPEDDVAEMSSEAGVRKWLLKVMPPYYADHIRWITTYRFHQVVADVFTDPNCRVLLAGEAAHLFPPFGGRGLNSGLVDAAESAKAIALALAASNEEQGSSIIRACAEDRRQAALFNRDAATLALDMLAPKSPLLRLRQTLASLIAPWSRTAGRWLSLGPNGRIGGRPGQHGSY